MTSRFYCLPSWFVPSMEDIERLKSIGIARMMQAHIYADKRTHIIHKTEDTTQDTQCTTDLQDAIHNIGHAIQDTQHTHTDKHNTYSTQNKRAHTHPPPETRTGLPMDCTSEQANKAFSQYGTAPWFYWLEQLSLSSKQWLPKNGDLRSRRPLFYQCHLASGLA